MPEHTAREDDGERRAGGKDHLRLRFCGAAGTVTGSCFRIRTPGSRFLVDCGMFQGPKSVKALNYEPFPFDPRTLDFVLLTHAHIDHSGLLPKLVRHGFDGPIHATQGTIDLLTYMLPDSGYIQEMEVERLNRRNRRRGIPPVVPIYGEADAEAALRRLVAAPYETWIEPGPGLRARFWNAGHILGSASIEIEAAGRRPQPTRLLFSGDVGPDNKLFHPDPSAPSGFDHVVCEATYGGRRRPDATPDSRRRILEEQVRAALGRGGNLLIPAFAVERTQELLLDLSLLSDQGRIPDVPIFLDSPLAIRATEVFARNARSLEDLAAVPDLFRRRAIRLTETVEESKAIERVTGGAIIMAGSGMCEAGRIRHHLRQHLWRPDSTVLLVGYQAPGTLGALLAGGAQAVKILGEDIRVAAAIRQIDVYSGHADGDELVAWVKAHLPVSGAVFLTHGEEERLAALRRDLEAAGLPSGQVVVPRLDDEVDLRGDGRRLRRAGPRRLAPEAVAAPDWHNDLAAFSLRLRERLEAADGDRARKAILRRVARALDTRRR